MKLSRESKLVCGIILLVVPTIMYGGMVLLGVVTQGTAGFEPGAVELDETQRALWRAGHAHAGVWVVFSLVIQVLVDAARLSPALEWTARLAAPLAAVVVSAGFFGLAFFPAFRWLLYAGGLCLATSVVLVGIGLIRNR